jgi:hypothetical protein
LPSFDCNGVICFSTSANDLRILAVSASLSIKPSSGNQISASPSTATAQSAGRSAWAAMVRVSALVRDLRNDSPAFRVAATGPSARMIGRTLALSGTFRSAFRVRIAVIFSCHWAITPSASRSTQVPG